MDVGNVKAPLVRCTPTVGSVFARLDSEQLHINAEVYLAAEIIDKEAVKVLNSCSLKKDKEIKKDAGCVRVYFPKEGDTLWEIAKKYHVSSSALREKNNMEGAELSAEKSLII